MRAGHDEHSAANGRTLQGIGGHGRPTPGSAELVIEARHPAEVSLAQQAREQSRPVQVTLIVTDRNLGVAVARRRKNPFCLFHRRGHWLLDQRGDPRLEERHSHVAVGVIGRRDDRPVARTDELVRSPECLGSEAVVDDQRPCSFDDWIDQGDNFYARDRQCVREMRILSDKAGTHDAEAEAWAVDRRTWRHSGRYLA